MALGDPIYLDSSALVKLVLDETESETLREFLLDSTSQMASSEIADVELVRTVFKADPAKMDAALLLLTQTVLLPSTTSIRVRAGYVKPEALKSLNAIHLATALEIQDDLDCLVTYDKRLADAGKQAGLRVMSPGAA